MVTSVVAQDSGVNNEKFSNDIRNADNDWVRVTPRNERGSN
jgi:hypothetical protein